MAAFVLGIVLGICFDGMVTAIAKGYSNLSPQQQPYTLSNQIDRTDITPDRPKRSPALPGLLRTTS